MAFNLWRMMWMYLQKGISKKTRKKICFCWWLDGHCILTKRAGSGARSVFHRYGSTDLRIRIRNKMSRIRNTAVWRLFGSEFNTQHWVKFHNENYHSKYCRYYVPNCFLKYIERNIYNISYKKLLMKCYKCIRNFTVSKNIRNSVAQWIM
jgi:hypothetical protein